MDALLKHQGVEVPPPPPSGLSSEVERLANAPGGKIAAIKLHRQQTGAGLAEAKVKIEEFLQSK
jgi:ribosomal protein L7/L12